MWSVAREGDCCVGWVQDEELEEGARVDRVGCGHKSLTGPKYALMVSLSLPRLGNGSKAEVVS